jgi:hypothetical protein
MYLGKGNTIKIGFLLCTQNAKADQIALLDSGATECFIYPEVVQQLKMPLQMLAQPKRVINVDRTDNKAGKITQKVTLDMLLKGKTKPINFLVMNTGADDFIFGFSFLTMFNPNIDWINPQIGPIKVLSKESDMISKPEQLPPDWV